MSPTDVQFDNFLILMEEQKLLHQRERAIILLMTSLILNMQRVYDVLDDPAIDAQQHEKALFLEALFDNNPYRKKKAYTILFCKLGIHHRLIEEVLSLGLYCSRRRFLKYKRFGLQHLLTNNRKPVLNRDNPELRELIFEILHSPPSQYGINRTTWTIPLLKEAILKTELILIGKNTLSQIIKKGG